MASESDDRQPKLEEGNDKWGLIVLLLFLLGVPLLGILLGLFGDTPSQ